MQLPLEMYKNYILRRFEDCALLKIAIQDLDISTFKKIGHQIKGNAASFGFDDLTQLGEKMNLLEKEKIQSDGQIILDEFESWIHQKKQSFHIS